MAQENKPHVTYLLGAGASCETLPLVSNLAKRVNRIINWLESNRGLITLKIKTTDSSIKRIKSLLLNDLKFLEENADTSRHFSIDTFAKKLFLWNHNNAPTELERLKFALQIYFMIEQLYSNPHTHIRYDSFFASILNRKIDNGSWKFIVPNNISFLTWNYDFQIEKSLHKEFKIDNPQEHFFFFPNKNIKSAQNIDASKLNIIRLNGTSGMMLKGIELIEFYNMTENLLDQQIKEILNDRYISNNRTTYKSMIDFAWEDNNALTNTSRKLAKEVAQQTNCLVSIGYSFPDFNSDIDGEILEEMFKSEKLRAIYIQAESVESVEHIKSRVITLNKKSKEIIKTYVNKDKFLLPREIEFEPELDFSWLQ